MITITPQMRILVATEPTDFRKGIDGLVALCRQALQSDPYTGTLFVFRSRNRRALKILSYDGQGFWLCQKRLSQGRYGWWPPTSGEAVCKIEAYQLQLLLWNGNPANAQAAPLWRPLATAA